MRNLYTVLGRTTHKTSEAVRSYGRSFGKVTQLVLATLVIVFLSNLELNAQITNTTWNFNANATGWTGTITRTTATTACGSASMRRNLYASVTTGTLISPVLPGTNNLGTITVSYKYKAANWSANTVGTNPWGSFNVQYGPTATGPWTTFATVSQETQNGTCITKTHSFTPPAGAIYLKWDCFWSAGDYYINFDDIIVSQAAAVACSGTPTPGNTLTSASAVAPGGTVNLSLQNATTGTGVSYQWQSAPTSGGAWTNIGGATASTYTATVTANTWYRCLVTCGGNTGTSTASQVTLTYCTPTNTNTGDYISAFSTTLGSTNVSTSGTSTAALEDYTSQVVTSYPGGIVNFSGSYVGGNAGLGIWIDWNNNLVFDASELMYVTTAIAANWSGSITVPAGQALGNYRMRIRAQWNTVSPPACGAIGYGQAEDYTFTLTAPPSCTAPSGLTSSAITATGATISWTAASPAPASGYQYYVSTSSTAPTAGTTPTGTTGAGVTTATLTGLNGVTTYYFWVRSDCGGSGTSTWSTVANFTTLCGLNTVVLNMADSWGDGWNGATYTLVNNSTSTTVGTGTLATGSSGSATFCVADGCYQFTTSDDTFDEMSWSLTVNGTATASGIDNASEVISINSVCGVPGCMDPASDNYNPLATVDNGSCVYLCASATALTCGTATNYTNAAGNGSWNSLGGPYGTPGTEQLFTYTPTTTGNYTISVTSNAWNDLYYSTSCSSTGWTYVDDITGSANNILALTGGTTYYFLLDPEGTTGVTGTITASCYTPPAWTDAWVSMNTGTSTWCAGETRTISVTVTNTGASTWTNATPDINIGVKWNADADYFVRTDANGLAPGATQTYNLTVTAPLTAGSNNLTFDIVNEFNFWFANNTNGGGPGNVVYTSPAITIVASPTMNAGADQTVCEAASITLTDAGTGSTSLSWNNGVSNGVAFNAPSSTTTYTVTGTNAAGCTSTDQVVITVKPLPVVNAGADQTVCQGVTANLTGTVTGGSCIMSLTTSGGSFASEKWVNITTAANGGGTVVWAQGNGTIGNASGLLTNQSINLSSYIGQTLYLNTYDAYDDSWDGSVYNLSFNGTTVINNGGVSPTDGLDTDALSTWESIAAEMETSEAFTVPALTYAWTSSPAGFTSSSLSAAVSPTQTTTYTLSSTYAGCTGSDAVTVTLPTAGSALAQNNETATCIVNQNGWVHFYHSSGRLIASVNSQGQDLGAVTATSYVEGAPVSVDACGNSNPIYATTVMGRHWVITPTHQPTSAVLVRLPYANTEFSDLTSAASTNANSNDDLLTPADLGMTKYSNGTAANVNADPTDNCGVGTSTFHTQMGNGTSTAYSSVNASYADFSIPGFSEFWLHGSAQASPLPVELVSFQANCAGEGKVNVTWTTASEHNSANFTIEKSRDGINWTVMASLAGAGNSTQMINYSTVDNNAAAGVNYYRLTQTDFDGASETFNIASANCGDNTSLTTVKVYPNPSAGDFYIDFTSEEITGASVITITDARGMEVYKMNVTVEKGSNVFHIDHMEAAPGMYYIQVSNGTTTSNIVKHSLR